MEYKLVGIREYDFEKEGRHFNGTKLFCTFEDKNTTGQATEAFTISKDKLAGFIPKPGMRLEIFYNKYGKVEDVREIK